MSDNEVWTNVRLSPIIREMSDHLPDRVPPRVLDYELADTVEADTPARLKALGDPLRALILDLVLERAMSVTELAARVRRPRGSIAHHVEVLVDAGMLQVVRTRRVRAVDERFYGRTALTIVFPAAAHDGDLPFFADARAHADLEILADEGSDENRASGFTLRHARIPVEAVSEFNERLMALA
ncbi:MAG: putative ArsR family transcriptional regulator, partial [Ilumatobacteraceae bacterium]|nr:putative ArsR family transcriptional regulator [Ilumatobacteraceae bacterium]